MAKTVTARRASAKKAGAASGRPEQADGGGANAAVQAWGPVGEYVTDAMQRTILFWDVMRQRSNQYYEQKAKAVPHVLSFDAELVLDGRTFAKPVNYLLVRDHAARRRGRSIRKKRPFVVVDPRAGHGPGIGGFKADSELGVAMRAGHPCYFVGFTPDPMPGQTIEDIMRAEAVFLEKVIALHPDAEGKPCVIGNCQAGWAVLLVAAIRPELFGPIIVPGSPLSYWAGVEGENPMRYTGGLAGGSWMTALAGDLGNGKFDGGMLVENFENLNPSNTLWTKKLQPLVQGRHRRAALHRVREVVGRPRQPQRRGDPVDRRRAVRRQPARHRRDRHQRRDADRPAQHPLADHLLLLQGRQHHAAAAGARLDRRPLRQRRRHPRLRPDHRLLRCTRASATSASSSPAAWRRRSTRSSRPTST